jgi:DNA-binding NarL/FixJ family response regulator
MASYLYTTTGKRQGSLAEGPKEGQSQDLSSRARLRQVLDLTNVGGGGNYRKKSYYIVMEDGMTDRNLASSSRASQKQSKSLTVGVLSPHPLVLSEFTKLLAGCSYPVKTKQLDPSRASHFANLHFPRCAVYVVDACALPSSALLVSEIIDRYPGALVVAVGDKFDEASAFQLLRAGTKGLLSYADARTDLPRAIEALLESSFWVPRVLLARFVDSLLPSARSRNLVNGPSGLSRREREVLQAVLENFSNKEIAGQLNISERTAKFHVSNLLAKFGVERRTDLILMYFKGPALGPPSELQA